MREQKPRVLVTIQDGVATAYVEGDVEVVIADFDVDQLVLDGDPVVRRDQYGNAVAFGSVVEPDADFEHYFALAAGAGR